MQAVKRLRRSKEETETERESMAEDRLSDMPESLQLRVLSSLDARNAVQTLVLSKSWVSSWTCIPVLNFSSYGFKELHVFDNFVVNALSRRQSGVKLDRLTFNRRGKCSPKMLEKVFDYALSHGVEQLEANILDTIKQNHEKWPIWLHTSSDSLTSLKLHSTFNMSCWFLQPRSGSFKNLTNLHLQRVLITDLYPFSGFPVLEKLVLVCCLVNTDGHALNVHAPQLSEFTFFYYNQDIGNCEFTTPKLRYFEWGGSGFPRLKGSLPVIDTVVINYNGSCLQKRMKMMLDDLLVLFNTLCSAKSLTVSAPVVHLLASFPDELLNFRDLKCLKLDFSSHQRLDLDLDDIDRESSLFLNETLKLVPAVKAYLLHKSHDPKCTIDVNCPNAESHFSEVHG